jgi:flagellar basal body-associated protein FliL
MKKALIIIAVVLVPILIYLGIVLYVAYQLNNVPKPYSQAIIDIQKPSFTIDWFDKDEPLPTIKTAAQAEEEMNGFTASDLYNAGYYEPIEYPMY